MTSTTSAPAFAYTPSTIILNSFSQAYVDGANVQIAPWIMGSFADFFLQGVLAVQVTNYFTYNSGDGTHRRFAWLVILVTLLCLLKSAQNVYIVWNTVLSNFANPDVSMMLVATNWVHYSTSLSTAIIAILIQSFFVYRYWLLTKRWYVCAVMGVAMLVSLVAASLVIRYIPTLDNHIVKVWSLVHFVAAIIVDTAITVLTAWHLYGQKTHVFSNSMSTGQTFPQGRAPVEANPAQSTATMIDRLIRMTWQSALPPTICVIINAAVLESRPIELTHIAFNMVLPMLYAISLMYTLNTRNELQRERMSSNDPSAHDRSRATRPGSQNPLSFNPKRSFGGTEMGGPNMPYRSASSVERGISGRGRSRGGSAGRRLDVHVETVVTRSQGMDADVEMDDFISDPIKSLPMKDSHDVDFERDVWDAKR